MQENIIIVGSSGSIGSEFTNLYMEDQNVGKIIALSRKNNDKDHKKIHSIEINYNDEETFKNLDELLYLDNISKVIVATGILHTEQILPEKSINNIDSDAIKKVFQVNTFGPILLIKKLMPLIKKSEGVKIAFLTARVGSISDNQLGGWHSYRSSKSALNMMIKNLSIELKRMNKSHIAIGIHPGTVKSQLSDPFLRHVKHDIFSPKESVNLMVQVINNLGEKDSGKCFDFSGKVIEP